MNITHTVCLVWIFWLCGFASAQVNIFNPETVRKMELDLGWYNSITLNLTSHSGNTDLLTLRAKLRSDYLVGKSHTFVMANFQQGKKDGKSFIDKGLIHLRSVQSVSQSVAVEAFVQKQFDDFILLQDRNLAGGGIRIVPLGQRAKSENGATFRLFIGVGAMWENEVINDSQKGEIETDIVRSTNYISGAWQINEWLASTTTNYYQFNPKSYSDFRILFEGSIGFRLTKRLTFSMQLNFRYDNEPPTDVEKHDLEIINGFNYAF
ncbi:DUF481 domain-containing protein [Candidatus Poribacteria bacterium]|nr:DUF481 domain-containing protein [Candidatus Poribacteria bacterium]